MPELVSFAAIGAAVLMMGIAGLQAALALGAPLGAYAWGGQHRGVLPPRLQLGSALSVPALVGMAIIVLIRAGVLYPDFAPAMTWPVWAIFLFLMMNTFGNLASKSGPERMVMTPISAVTAALVCVVAMANG
jgi:hypothetical protein